MIKSRIAPTPSGLLHRGNAFNFLLTSCVTGNNGNIRLRIDDLDAPRVRQEYMQDIFETLDWLKIFPDSGPKNVGEQEEHYSQQLRIPRYHQVLATLCATGNVFACTCSRKEMEEQSTDGQYPGTCRHKNLPLNTPDAALRFKTNPETMRLFKDELLGSVSIDLYTTARDFVIRRREGIPAYHIASLTDDVDFGINTIVRGEDLLVSTAVQLHLAEQLGFHSFCGSRFFHHPLLANAVGGKLSKSAGSASIRSIRESGVSFDQFYQEFLDWKQGFGLD